MIKTDALEENICRVIGSCDVLSPSGMHSKLSTKKMFAALTHYAYELDLWVWSEPNEADKTLNEWLYDFVIYEGSASDISRIRVALESEMSIYFH